jgi:hypothetical protein
MNDDFHCGSRDNIISLFTQQSPVGALPVSPVALLQLPYRELARCHCAREGEIPPFRQIIGL